MVAKVTNTAAAETVFDVSRITGREMARYFKALTQGDVEVQAELLSKAVASTPHLPPDADLASPDTYLDMPYYDGMGVLIREIQVALKKAAGN